MKRKIKQLLTSPPPRLIRQREVLAAKTKHTMTNEINQQITAHERAVIILERIKWRVKSLEIERENHNHMVEWFGNYEGSQKRQRTIAFNKRMLSMLHYAYELQMQIITQ
jgi:hypothetical protein